VGLSNVPNTDFTSSIAAKVSKTGDETVAGVKTFSSSPIVPAPTTDLEAATKKYVDDNAGGGSGDVDGPASATDNAIARFDSTTGKLIQDSKVTISDSGNVVNFANTGGVDLKQGGMTMFSFENQGAVDKGGRLFITNSQAEGDTVLIQSLGSYTNISLDLLSKGTGKVQANGVEVATVDSALMDSEVTNLAQVKAFDSTDYATAAQGTKADNALQARGAVNAQTGTTYTLVIGDEYLDGVRQTNASPNTVTIPPNADVAFPVGSTKILIIQGGAGSTTIAAGAGVTLSSPASVTAAIGEINGSRVIQKVGVNEWLLI
jgi:hypothetical protein